MAWHDTHSFIWTVLRTLHLNDIAWYAANVNVNDPGTVDPQLKSPERRPQRARLHATLLELKLNIDANCTTSHADEVNKRPWFQSSSTVKCCLFIALPATMTGQRFSMLMSCKWFEIKTGNERGESESFVLSLGSAFFFGRTSKCTNLFRVGRANFNLKTLKPKKEPFSPIVTISINLKWDIDCVSSMETMTTNGLWREVINRRLKHGKSSRRHQ